MSFGGVVSAYRRYRGILVATCLCLLFVCAPSAFGQVDEGSITGVILDPTGAVVSNAQVTLLNTDQGITLEVRSSSSGTYTFAPVRIGHYTVTATAPGFSTITQQNLTVAVGQKLQVNVTLQSGATSETVTVTAAPPQLQTMSPRWGRSSMSIRRSRCR